MSDKVKVTLKRGLAGTLPKQRATVKALGLGKIGSSSIVPNRPEIKGMIYVVQHLVTTEEVSS